MEKEVFNMAKRLSCRDVGADCDFTVCAETEQEIFGKMAEHARTDHGMNEIPKETYDKARSAMHEVERC
jgi:predicted small metal-binding protein